MLLKKTQTNSTKSSKPQLPIKWDLTQPLKSWLLEVWSTRLSMKRSHTVSKRVACRQLTRCRGRRLELTIHSTVLQIEGNQSLVELILIRG